MMEGKPWVYNGFVSHDDHVVTLPPGAVHLATNAHSSVQALAVTHKKGTFWATQYHAEYNLYEVARLIVSREYRLVPEKFFADHDDLMAYVDRLERLHRQPDQKHLRWQLDADDTVIDDDLRQLEFHNFVNKVVLPAAAQPRG
jgi:GMP synthase (glutamine-hydrolysing)